MQGGILAVRFHATGRFSVPSSLGKICHLRRWPIYKDSDRGDRGRKGGDDLRGSVRLHKTRRTGVKVKSDPIDTGRGASRHIFDASQAADLHSDDGVKHEQSLRKIARLTPCSNLDSPPACRPGEQAQDTPSLSSDCLNLFSGFTPTKRSTSLPF